MRKFSMILVAALNCYGIAHADNYGFWGAAGATCVPGDPAIQADRYLVTAGSVKFNDGASGLVTLYCPILAPPTLTLTWSTDPPTTITAGPNVLRLTYLDSDGADGDANVTAQVIALSKDDGSLTLFPNGFVDSNAKASPDPATLATWQLSNKFTQPIDFSKNYYYVRVDLNRGVKATSTVIFYGVALELEQ